MVLSHLRKQVFVIVCSAKMRLNIDVFFSLLLVLMMAKRDILNGFWERISLRGTDKQVVGFFLPKKQLVLYRYSAKIKNYQFANEKATLFYEEKKKRRIKNVDSLIFSRFCFRRDLNTDPIESVKKMQFDTIIILRVFVDIKSPDLFLFFYSGQYLSIS